MGCQWRAVRQDSSRSPCRCCWTLLEASGELDDEPRYTPAVRDELVAMSAATIDRYLAPVRATEQLRGKSTTKAGPLLRSSIKIRKAGGRDRG